MTKHKATAKVGKGGKIILENVPFAEGDEVEVTVETAVKDGRQGRLKHPMRGSVIRYDDPFEPACPPEEWEAQN